MLGTVGVAPARREVRAMNVTAIVDLIKGGGPAWPRLESDTHLMSIGSGRPLEEAWRAGQIEMIGWLGELYGLDRLDAYPAAHADLPNADRQRRRRQLQRRTKIDKRLLPVSRAYGGMHEQMRSAAVTLGTISY